MGIENWTLFIQERLRAYDPEINLNQGSPATVQVIDPIVNRLAPDPIETNLNLFLLTRLQQEFPSLYAQEGATITDLLIKPHLVLMEPLRREIRSIKNQLSLIYPEQLSADEADALMANLFVTRNSGEYAKVKVRLYFQNPISVNISSANVAYTATGLRFLPTQSQSITAEGMLFNTEGGLYYFDVSYVAERPGTRYNISATSIINVTGIQAATRVTNLAKATPGTSEETTRELIERGERSIGERSLTTIPGIVHSLFTEFTDLRILQVIGFNDVEMNRDTLVGGNLGPVLYSGTDGVTSDDGDGDGYTWYFSNVAGAAFDTIFGPVGTDISQYTLTVWHTDPVTGLSPHDYTLDTVTGSREVKISTDYTDTDRLLDSLAGAYWCIRESGILTLSDVPGGILFPDSSGATVTVPNDTVHIGGMTDFYVRGTATEDEALEIALVSDQEVVKRGEDAQTTNSSPVVILDDLSSQERDLIVEGRSTLYLEQGSDEGSYTIVQVYAPGPPYTVRLDQDMSATATDISYTIVDDIDVDLLEPKDIKYEGTDLRTVAGTAVLDTVSGSPDFVSVGVTEDDVVEILNGDQIGVYEILTGGVSSSQIVLESSMGLTESPLNYRIYTRQDGIELPLVRIKSVERLDSNLEPTGEMVPYKHPVDVVSNSFQNPGRGAKASTALVVTEDSYLRATAGSKVITARKEDGSAYTSIDFWDLGVRAGDIINITSTQNQGFYTVELVGTKDGLTNDYDLQVTEAMRWSSTTGSDMEYSLGAPSYGSFRVYFLDPVSFEATYESVLISVSVGGTTYRYRPDPDVYDQYLPTVTTIPTIQMTGGDSIVKPYSPDGGTNIDLHPYSLEVGDRIEITYAPLIGSADLSAGGVATIDEKYVKIDVGYGSETVTFSGTSLSIDEIISQINAQISREVCVRYDEVSPGTGQYVMLRGDIPISIISDGETNDCTDVVFGTNRGTWNSWFPGDSFKSGVAGTDKTTSNASPEKGYYSLVALYSYPTGDLELEEEDGSAWTAGGNYTAPNAGHYIRVSRQGRQSLSSTAMSDQGTTALGFYYIDLECISEGYGDAYNIGEDVQGTIAGYYSEGWEITAEDPDHTFSMAEEPWIRVSPTVLMVGEDADEVNKTELTGLNIQVTYERDPLVEQVHDYVRDVRTRVVCQNPLARALLPIFVRTAISYNGGDTETDIRSSLSEWIENVLPENELEASDLVDLIMSTGSDYVSLPITLVGIAHQVNRTITVERSEDFISTGRLSSLIPDDDGTTTEGSSYIFLTRGV